MVPQDEPDSPDVLCSAEVHAHRMIYSPPGFVGPPKEGWALAITSLFVPHGQRAQGYGRTFVQRLAQDILQGGDVDPLEPPESGKPVFIFGHSGIGNPYAPYAYDYGVEELVIDVESSTLGDDSSVPKGCPIFGDAEEIKTVMDEDARLIVGSFERQQRSPEPTFKFAILPDPDAAMWRITRMDYTLDRLRPDDATKKVWGSKIVSSSDGDHGPKEALSYCLWSPDVFYDNLLITRIRSASPKHSKALIREALREARRWNLKYVVVSDVEESSLEGVTVVAYQRETEYTPVGRILVDHSGQGVRTEWMAKNQEYFLVGFR